MFIDSSQNCYDTNTHRSLYCIHTKYTTPHHTIHYTLHYTQSHLLSADELPYILPVHLVVDLPVHLVHQTPQADYVLA